MNTEFLVFWLLVVWHVYGGCSRLNGVRCVCRWNYSAHLIRGACEALYIVSLNYGCLDSSRDSGGQI